MPFVYSTATNSNVYVEYHPGSPMDSHSQIKRKVLIHGGHGVATRNLVTPKGVVTEVTDEELEFLMSNQAFLRHMKAGYITVDKVRVDPAERAANMASADGSAPLTPEDFKEGKNSDENSRVFKGKSKR